MLSVRMVLEKRSCITQLLEVMQDFSRLLDDGNSLDVTYLDFKKAIDPVPHERLLTKLHSYGISGKFLECCLRKKKDLWYNDKLINQ